MSEQTSERKVVEKKVVSRNVAIALGIICIVFLAGLVGAIANYTSTISGKDNTITTQNSEIADKNSTITYLNSTITSLQTWLNGNITQARALQNDSARLQLELSIVEQVGKLSIYTYYVNDTMTVAPNSTVLLTSQVNGYNGTIVFISPNGCYSAGAQAESVQPQYVLDILLNSNSPPLTSAYTSLSGQPYSVYFKNIGSSPVQCTFSLFYVYQKPD
jgi:hypothetical protein